MVDEISIISLLWTLAAVRASSTKLAETKNGLKFRQSSGYRYPSLGKVFEQQLPQCRHRCWLEDVSQDTVIELFAYLKAYKVRQPAFARAQLSLLESTQCPGQIHCCLPACSRAHPYLDITSSTYISRFTGIISTASPLVDRSQRRVYNSKVIATVKDDDKTNFASELLVKLPECDNRMLWGLFHLQLFDESLT